MKSIWGLSLVTFFGVIAFSCLEAPQYSAIPDIEFEQIVFKDVKDASSADSLIVSIKFRDGDGNVGLDPSEKQPPYNDKYYFQFADKSYITYKTKRTVPGYDTLPDFVKPYNCINWEVFTQNQKVIDTLYFQLNPNQYNIFITFQVKDALGNFQDFDWASFYTYPLCEVIGFNGRFPILSKDLSQPGPLEGTIKYAMNSVGFNIIFSIRTLRLKIKIIDRDLNSSNEILTPEFTLQSIK
ncbi:MAG: hypothetical protein JJE09_00115 [Bacteroidia bacterium]|nr:hypothetical protein [Bacteroidia bacterium]